MCFRPRRRVPRGLCGHAGGVDGLKTEKGPSRSRSPSFIAMAELLPPDPRGQNLHGKPSSGAVGNAEHGRRGECRNAGATFPLDGRPPSSRPLRSDLLAGADKGFYGPPSRSRHARGILKPGKVCHEGEHVSKLDMCVHPVHLHG